MRRSLAAAAAALLTMLVVAAPAPAKPPPDDHMPNPQTGYCPGGRELRPGNALVCDGVPYADGSHWRYVWFTVSIYMPGMDSELRSMYGLNCVVGDELRRSALAPPGSCLGAV